MATNDSKHAVHALTRQQLDQFIARPGHALLLAGPAGSGKRSLALATAEAILERNFSEYAYGKNIAPKDGKSIGIEAIRELEQFLSLKVPGNRQFDRIVLIEDAHSMGHEAQNALLKTLEEPPSGTIIILTAKNEQALLPTIRSRVQLVSVRNPERSQIDASFADFDLAQVKQSYAVSGGLPGLMHALLSDTDHPLTLATQKARLLLSQTTFERLTMVDELSKQRQLAEDVLFILLQMAHVSLLSAQGEASKRWQTVLAASYDAAESLANSGQPKLVLTKLMLSL